MSTVEVSLNAFPVSSVSRRANSSLRARKISTARRKIRARSTAVLAAHSRCPCTALCTAASTSALDAC